MSCWAFTQATNEATALGSYYFLTTDVADTNDLSAKTAITVTAAWNAGFDTLWSCDTVVSDSTQNHVTCSRFLPSLADNVSPTGDWRFAPVGTKNPSQATSDQIWVYGGTAGTGSGAGVWATYTVALQGGKGMLGTIGALAVAMLTY